MSIFNDFNDFSIPEIHLNTATELSNDPKVAAGPSKRRRQPEHSEPQPEKTDTQAHHQPPASTSSSGPSTGAPPNRPNPDTL